MRPWAAWAVGAALVVAAWGVAAVTPPDDAATNPFPVNVSVGEHGVGRNIAGTVTDVRRAETVSAGGWSADGNWVVVDLDIEAVVSEFGVRLNRATLDLDGRTYSASERPDSLRSAPLSVGIPRSGSLAFELPDSAAGGDAVLRLGLDADERLDSVIVLELDLADIEVDNETALVETGWSAP